MTVGTFVSLFLVLAIVLVLRRFFTLISPLLERFTSSGGQMKIPSLRDLIGIFGLKMMEQLDFSKVASSLFPGMSGGKK